MKTKNSEPEIEQLIGKPPGWLFNSGISIIAIVIVVFLCLASVVRYPDKIESVGIMTSDNPPIEHLTFIGGIVDSILVQESDNVETGDKLLLIQNPCRTEDLNILKLFINRFENINTLPEYFKVTFPLDLHLGELQPEYARLQLTFTEFLTKSKHRDLKWRLEILKSQINNLRKLNVLLREQISFADSELQIVTNDYSRNRALKNAAVISDVDFEKSNRELLTYQKQYTGLENGIVENEIRQQELKLEIEKLISERADLENDYILKLREITSVLKQNIRAWEEKYFIIAKVSGKISLASNVTKKCRVAADQHVLSILPNEYSSKKFVRAVALEIGIGKIKVGDQVILKMDQFPHKEFGVLHSTIISISVLPKTDKNDNHLYEIKIPLPDQIVTTYKKLIPFSPNTGVHVEIITENKSIMQRVLNEFLNLIKNI